MRREWDGRESSFGWTLGNLHCNFSVAVAAEGWIWELNGRERATWGGYILRSSSVVKHCNPSVRNEVERRKRMSKENRTRRKKDKHRYSKFDIEDRREMLLVSLFLKYETLEDMKVIIPMKGVLIASGGIGRLGSA